MSRKLLKLGALALVAFFMSAKASALQVTTQQAPGVEQGDTIKCSIVTEPSSYFVAIVSLTRTGENQFSHEIKVASHSSAFNPQGALVLKAQLENILAQQLHNVPITLLGDELRAAKIAAFERAIEEFYALYPDGPALDGDPDGVTGRNIPN